MGTETIKCLSIRQPWATWIMLGKKNIETRSWKCSHTGPLLIHAGLNDSAMRSRECRNIMLDYGLVHESYPVGVILGAVTMKGCYPVSAYLPNLRKRELEMGDYSAGRYGWLLEVKNVFKSPVKYTGKLGLFDVPVAELGGQYHA